MTENTGPRQVPSYDELALRTKSPGFDRGKFNGERFRDVLHDAQAAGVRADTMKRALFYTDKTELGEFTQEGVDAVHGLLGLISEVGELAEWFLNGGSKDNLLEELGDIEWYLPLLRKWIGVSQKQIQLANIAKLAQRYPDRFNDVRAQEENRDRDEEMGQLRQAIQGGLFTQEFDPGSLPSKPRE